MVLVPSQDPSLQPHENAKTQQPRLPEPQGLQNHGELLLQKSLMAQIALSEALESLLLMRQ